MCVQERKRLKSKRGYADVIYLLRIYNVPRDVRGYELLQMAIMKHLENANLKIEDLVKTAYENASIKMSNSEECFKKMKEALQNINAPIELLEEDFMVMKFIKKISTEVRMRALLELRVASEELEDFPEYAKSAFCSIAIRKIEKPGDSFLNLLNYVAGSYGYEDIDDLIKVLYKIVAGNKKITDIEAAKTEIEMIMDVFIAEYENMIF